MALIYLVVRSRSGKTQVKRVTCETVVGSGREEAGLGVRGISFLKRAPPAILRVDYVFTLGG